MAVVWGSTNPAVVEVDGTGLVRGVRPGSAAVVVSHRGVAAQVSVTVTPAPAGMRMVTPGERAR